MSVSVVILTLNEQESLPGCLESLSWCDDVVVFDSHSTDDTEQIARDMGARVFQRRFDNYAAQRNAALTDVEYKHAWVLMVDADERATPELADEIEQTITSAEDDMVLYRMRRKDYFMGRWLRRSSCYPTWFGRLMRLGRVKFEREINEDTVADGKTGMLKEHLIHYPFSKGMAFWFERHNRYSSMEAEALLIEVQEDLALWDVFSSDPTVRRKALKRLAYRLPFRRTLVFNFLYFVRLGILDGRPGLAYCRVRAFYEYMIDLKMKELRRRAKGLPI